MPRVDIHILSYNEAEMLAWTLAAYSEWDSRVIVHDAASTDDTREMIHHNFPAVVILDWNMGG